MTVFDENVINNISELDSITEDILLCLKKAEDNPDLSKEIEKLYKKRKPLLENVEDYYNKNTKLITDNKSDWESLVVPVREKDEKALKLLGGKVKNLQTTLIKKQKQKSLLIYEKEQNK